MVKHVILWQLKDGLSADEKRKISEDIKVNLEALKGKVPGLVEIRVNTEPLASSNADVMLDCALESEDALKGYAVNPAHVAAASTYVSPFIKTRVCMDFSV